MVNRARRSHGDSRREREERRQGGQGDDNERRGEGGTIHEKRIPACVCTCYGAFYAPLVRSPGTAIAAGPEIEILRESMRGAHRLHTYATTFHTIVPPLRKAASLGER